MTAPVVITRKSRETELALMGVTGAALECLLSETTQERHQSRVAYARLAAEEYYLDTSKLDRADMSRDTLKLVAGAILWADVVGVGGRDGVEGIGTARHPAFASCGKGRKQASDGGAWSSAIRVAAHQCGGCFGIRTIADGNSALLYIIEGGSALVDDTIAPMPWVYSILREGLRRAAGLRTYREGEYGGRLGWHADVPFDAPPESIGLWAQLVNETTTVPAPLA